MPPAFRQCSFCSNNSNINAEVVFFTVTERIRSELSFSLPETTFICEKHFNPNDIKIHGSSKRLRDDAVPVLFPRKQALLLDHCYVKTAPLNLELDPDEDMFEDSFEEMPKFESNLFMEDEQPKTASQNIQSSGSTFQETPTNSQNVPSSGECYHPETPTGSQEACFIQPSNSGSANQEVPSSSQNHSQSSVGGSSNHTDASESDQETEGANVEGSSIIASWSCLLMLLSICRRDECGEKVLPSNMHITRNGAAVKVKSTCNAGHEEIWESCESIGTGKFKMPSINLYIIVYSFLTGMQFDKLTAFFNGCSILGISASSYYRYLKKVVYPVIWSYWLIEQAGNIATVMETLPSVVLCGDARYDSPGFSAKYCTYYIQETSTKKILALEVGMKGQVNCSSQMEVAACERLLNYLKSLGLVIRIFASDRSTSIRTLLATRFPEIKHQFDIWHFVKGINKRLFNFFKLKSCPNLQLWQKSITNMIWWAISSSIGNAALAKQKILSIFHHVSNEHHFPSFDLFNKCEHEEIEEERPWIKAGSFEMGKLREAIMGKNEKNLDDLPGMDEFVHTSDLESLNSLILKYCNKTYSYSWLGMLIRSALAAIDFNANVNRKAKVSADGETLYKIKIGRCGTKVTVVEQKEKKDYTFQDNILELCKDCLERGVAPQHEYPIDEEVIRKRKRHFDKAELVEKYVSRMKKSKTAP